MGLPAMVTGLVSGATAGTFSQALTNAWEGRSWHEGLAQAGLTGAIGGAIGGFVLGQLPFDAGLPIRMAAGSVASAAGGGVSHALLNELAGQDWREGLGRAIAVGLATGAIDAVTDYYGDRWQARQEANRHRRAAGQVDAYPRRVGKRPRADSVTRYLQIQTELQE